MDRLFPVHQVWSIDQDYIEQFASAHPGGTVQSLAAGDGEVKPYPGCEMVGDVAVVRIVGPLVKYSCVWATRVGGTALVEVADAIRQAAADPTARCILLEIDSPGGTVAGVDVVIDEIAKAPKRTAAFIGGVCAGAAYSLAAETQTIFADPQARVGAVGVAQFALDWWDTSPAHGQADSGDAEGEPPNGAAELTSSVSAFMLHQIRERRKQADFLAIERAACGTLYVAEHAEAAGLVDVVQPYEFVLATLMSRDPSPEGVNR